MLKGKYFVLRELGVEEQMSAYGSCVCNELDALRFRHLIDRGAQMDDSWEKITRQTEKFYDPLEKITNMEVISRYTGNKRTRYLKAHYQLQHEGLTPRDVRVKMFVKTERFWTKDIGVKPPRAIQFRSPKFNLCLLRYITPFEEHHYASLKYGVVSDTRVVAKGLNWVQRAKLFIDKASHFTNPLFINLDYSAFDSTITLRHLKSTHRKYVKSFGREIRGLLRHQLYNKGSTRQLRYKVTGTRMSGDADTGCGNTIINLDALYGFFLYNGIKKYDMLVDGDDSIVIVEKGALLDFSYFTRIGLIAKVTTTEDMFQVEFCQSRLVLADEPVFVRNPKKVLSATRLCLRPYLHKISDWAASVGACELAVNPGVPVLQVLGWQLSQLSAKRVFDRDLEARMLGMKNNKVKPITDLARLTFEHAWGVTIEMQLLIERILTEPSVSIYRTDSLLTNRDDEQIQRTRLLYECSPELGGSSWWNSS